MRKLSNLDYGSILITIHEGEITQLDITEKKRFPLTKNRVTDIQKSASKRSFR
ncbi:YezD family protein [Bacillus smithii]|uniref:DUF2292 domain-containing protein n=1 Tax=Bacillus smithii TaxID=1479 RepID=UPI003D1FE7A4